MWSWSEIIPFFFLDIISRTIRGDIGPWRSTDVWSESEDPVNFPYKKRKVSYLNNKRVHVLFEYERKMDGVTFRV